MIEYKNGIFGLHGEAVSCLVRINPYGLPELLHFGSPVRTEDAEAFLCRQGLGWGSSVLLEENDTESCADAMPLAWSGAGRGDYRESPISLGGCPTDFRYKDHKIYAGKPALEGLPATYTETDEEAQSLVITMYDNYRHQ